MKRKQNLFLFLTDKEDEAPSNWVNWNLARLYVIRFIIATEKNKKRIVQSLDVTKSEITIRFSVVDLVVKQVWLVNFFLKCGIFQRLKSEK